MARESKLHLVRHLREPIAKAVYYKMTVGSKWPQNSEVYHPNSDIGKAWDIADAVLKVLAEEYKK